MLYRGLGHSFVKSYSIRVRGVERAAFGQNLTTTQAYAQSKGVTFLLPVDYGQVSWIGPWLLIKAIPDLAGTPHEELFGRKQVGTYAMSLRNLFASDN
jgi:hypothetical protein